MKNRNRILSSVLTASLMCGRLSGSLAASALDTLPFLKIKELECPKDVTAGKENFTKNCQIPNEALIKGHGEQVFFSDLEENQRIKAKSDLTKISTAKKEVRCSAKDKQEPDVRLRWRLIKKIQSPKLRYKLDRREPEMQEKRLLFWDKHSHEAEMFETRVQQSRKGISFWILDRSGCCIRGEKCA